MYKRKCKCISFINIKDIKDIPIFGTMYNYGSYDKFKDYYSVMKSGQYILKDIFTEKMNDHMEIYNRGNFVTLGSFIDKTSISLVDFPDWYNLRQTFLKKSGYRPGELIRYIDCRKLSSLNDIPENVRTLYR